MLGLGLLRGTATLVAACEKQPSSRTSAVVANIAPGLRPRWDADKVQVTVRSAGGLVAVENGPLALLTRHVGDTVPASAQGLTLTLNERACVR